MFVLRRGRRPCAMALMRRNRVADPQRAAGDRLIIEAITGLLEELENWEPAPSWSLPGPQRDAITARCTPALLARRRSCRGLRSEQGLGDGAPESSPDFAEHQLALAIPADTFLAEQFAAN
jgi:hypothetical protein